MPQRLSLTKETLRLRVFAGPNGSGKSTVIGRIRTAKVAGKPLDFGVYVNADDIARAIKSGTLDFADYGLKTRQDEFTGLALTSGLVGGEFPEKQFTSSFKIERNRFRLLAPLHGERLAQIIADFLRRRLLTEKRKFSFETVFSHPSKVEFLRQAKEEGYKVYLYFVTTQDPDLNVYRVKKVRVPGNGHDVPEDKIRSRYYRSMELMYDASQHAYQAFFFDNSNEHQDSQMFAHFKLIGGRKVWDSMDPAVVPRWFITYYSSKAGSTDNH